MAVDKKGLGRVAIYYRVSTDKQDLDSQRQVVEKWIADLPTEKKPKSVRVFQDEGISGTTSRRPGFQEMVQEGYANKIDTIVCYRLDRFSRHATTAINLLLSLDEAGVAFISVTQPVLNLGHENPFRRTMLAAFAEIAEIERETIVTRVRAGLDAARKRGVKLGAPTKIDPAQRELVLRLRQTGKSLRGIAVETKLSLGTIHKIVNATDESLEESP